MKRILFPTDFSVSAHNALTYAARFCKGIGAELVLYHVSKILGSGSMETAHEKLDALSAEVRKTYGIMCSPVLQPAAITFSDFVGEEAGEYDLVIMGTNGADDLVQFFNGSHSFNVVLRSNVPLLLIPVEYTGAEISEVVYAYDYYKEQKLPLEQLRQWLNIIKKNTVTVLQVLKESASADIGKELRRVQTELQFENKPIELKFDTVYNASELAMGINQYMVKTDSAVLCLCTQKRGVVENFFRKSVIKGITGMAGYPMFIFHE
jgi:nucleotide-binding universal stress UspA family protein